MYTFLTQFWLNVVLLFRWIMHSKRSKCIERQEFVPRLTFKEQMGDNTLENIRKCTENAVNKRKEEKIP